MGRGSFVVPLFSFLLIFFRHHLIVFFFSKVSRQNDSYILDWLSFVCHHHHFVLWLERFWRLQCYLFIYFSFPTVKFLFLYSGITSCIVLSLIGGVSFVITMVVFVCQMVLTITLVFVRCHQISFYHRGIQDSSLHAFGFMGEMFVCLWFCYIQLSPRRALEGAPIPFHSFTIPFSRTVLDMFVLFLSTNQNA